MLEATFDHLGDLNDRFELASSRPAVPLLEKLVRKLSEKGAQVDDESIKHFYDWYKTKIVEVVNKSLEGSAQIEVGVDTKTTLLSLIGLVANTKAKLKGSTESKTSIRREVNNNFAAFGKEFNEFVGTLKEQLIENENYQDILFIVDGFEKIGSLDDRKKILVDDANKLTIVQTHMIITLPIELFTEKNRLNHFAITENFPLVDLKKDGAKKTFREFILKRVDKKLFESDDVIDMIIEYGAGHPRQTLQIINRAYVEAENETIDKDSVTKAVEILGAELSKVDEDEVAILKKVKNQEVVAENDTYIKLKSKNIIFVYDNNSASNIINPVVFADKDFQKHLASK